MGFEERGAIWSFFWFPKAERIRSPIKLILKPIIEELERGPTPQATSRELIR